MEGGEYDEIDNENDAASGEAKNSLSRLHSKVHARLQSDHFCLTAEQIFLLVFEYLEGIL